MKNRPGQLQLIAQPHRIAEISVVGQRHLSLLMIDLYGLAVIAVISARGSIPHVSHRHFALRQAGECVRRKHLADQSQILVGGKNAVVIHHNSTTLLPPVLQGIKPIINHACQIGGFRGNQTEHTAFFL